MKRAVSAFIMLLCLLSGAVNAQDANPFIPGKIAYVGSDFNVYTLSGETRTALTDDAGLDGDRVRYYQFPTWATDGRLAYFEGEITAQRQITTEVFVSADGLTPGASVYVGADENFTYAYWSPSACGANCFDLAVLLGSGQQSGFLVNVIRDAVDAPSVTQVGTGAPFYYSWSPDGQRMVWQRNNRQIDIYDVTTNEIDRTLDVAPGEFFAPAWSPVDDRVLFGVAGDAGTDLAVEANGELETLAEGLAGPIRFAWSPDGNLIAYKDAENALVVIDAITGERIAASDTADVVAFFWAPNSQRIAYVTLPSDTGSFSAKPSAQDTQLPVLSWAILDVGSGAVRRYGEFTPTSDELYVLSFYDQFGQSHRIWSPDSRHLVYSELNADGVPQIMLLDTESNFVPLSVAEGFVAVWSFE